jgi:hypothetical protein
MSVAVRNARTDAMPGPPVVGRHRRWTRLILPTYVAVVLVYMVSPILVMILYSFKTRGSRR